MRGARATRNETGYVAVMVSIMVPTLFLGLAAVGVDTARWYVEAEKVQLAADAAALAGVPFLPQDMTSATTRAKAVATRNGYDDTDPDVVVTVSQGVRDSQLRVTITSTIPNQFGRMIGVDQATVSRTAVADFTGPAPMGSPCNVFGTEPPSGTGGTGANAGPGGADPVGSAIGTAPLDMCPQNPQLWATVEGPQTGKVQGDRYGTVECETSNVDGCDSGGDNLEYEDPASPDDESGEAGYFWLVKVQPSMINQPVSLQLYDPAFVLTGQFCDQNNSNDSDDDLPNHSSLDNNMNPFARTDGKARYGRVDSSGYPSLAVPYCTGDSFPGNASGSREKMTTTFVLREQTDTQDPLRAAVQNNTAGQPCAAQFGAYDDYPTYNRLKSSSGSYRAELAETFHNWVELCTFTPTREGDYYLHVRTNKHYDFPSNTLIRRLSAASLASVTGEEGDASPEGGGSNSFGIRAVAPVGLERGVSVSGWDRMPIYVNSEAATPEFNLIRVLPGAAGQVISFDFFDAGDAAGTATVEVKLPADATKNDGTPITDKFPGGCKSTGGTAGTSGQTSATCTFTLTQNSSGVSRNNGKVQTINIPIPPDYKCTATDFLKCWYKVKIVFASGSVHDVTTWDAEIVGDPVRLIE
jgi:Flp pilus assembly protein TadG